MGAPGSDSNSGAVYVFRTTGDESDMWIDQEILRATNAEKNGSSEEFVGEMFLGFGVLSN